MIRRRSIIGLCMLSALFVSAFAAQSASAETTAFTCAPAEVPGPVGTKGFKDAHCKETTENVVGQQSNVKVEHKTFAPVTKTSFTVSNETTSGMRQPVFLHSVQSGVIEELEATEVSGSGTLENKEEGGKMLAHGTGTITFKGVTFIKPAGKGCKVKAGEITTKELTAKTTEEMGIKYTPAAGETFATFEVEGCSIAALNGLYEVKGSITSSEVNGSTSVFQATQTTEQSTLKVRGQKAGLSCSFTTKAKDPEIVGDEYKALTLTTPPYV